MKKDTFFPNRIIYFLLTLLLAMVIDSPLIMFLKDENDGIKQTIFFVIFSITFLLIIGVVNIRKKNKVLSFYTNRFDLLWLALLTVVVIQCLISQPIVILLDKGTTNEVFDLATILGSLILAPVLEEIIFRGILLRGLLTRYSSALSIVLSSLLFALIHINMTQITPAFLLGLLFGLIFVKTHSLIFTIILHFWANAISWICTYGEIRNIFQIFTSTVLVMIVIFALIIYGYCMMIFMKRKMTKYSEK